MLVSPPVINTKSSKKISYLKTFNQIKSLVYHLDKGLTMKTKGSHHCSFSFIDAPSPLSDYHSWDQNGILTNFHGVEVVFTALIDDEYKHKFVNFYSQYADDIDEIFRDKNKFRLFLDEEIASIIEKWNEGVENTPVEKKEETVDNWKNGLDLV